MDIMASTDDEFIHSSSHKRKRSTNYLPEEKNLILKLLVGRRDIIENKQTNAASSRQKESCWNQIALEFNAQRTTTTYRSAESLKIFYGNQKRQFKKDVPANTCTNIFANENSTSETSNPTCSNYYASSESLAEACGLDIKTEDVDDAFEVETNESKNYKSPTNEVINESVQLFVGNKKSVGVQTTMTDYVVQNLNNSNKVKPWKTKKRSWMLHSINLSKHKLFAVKQKIAQLELERQQKEFEIKIKSLQLDIDIKQELLKKISEMNPNECVQKYLANNLLQNS